MAFALAMPFIITGCKTTGTTLAAGGVYTDPYLAKTDQFIFDSAKSLDDFVTWQSNNAAFLSKWPEVAALAQNVSANKSQWIKDAYAARDSYASAEAAYKAAIAAGNSGAIAPTTAKVDAAVAVITNITNQIIAYKAAHNV